MEKNLKIIFEQEKQLLPEYNRPTFVDLIRTIYSKYIDVEANEEIKNLIPQKKHTVLILIDGMGSNLINILPSDSIFKKNKKKDLLTVSPSSTGCVITSLATAEYPATHGIIGWYNYNREKNLEYYPVLFSERYTNQNLKKLNIKETEIYQTPSKFKKLGKNTFMLYPNAIVDSDFSKFIACDDQRIGYKNYDDAIKKINEIINKNETSFTYMYISEIDDLEHEYGYDNEIVIDKVFKIEQEIKKLLLKDTTVIITADHGQTNVKYDVVMDFDKYKKFFYALPTIDFGTASYYVEKDKRKEFEKTFEEDYNKSMILINTDEFVKNHIFGPEKISEYMQNNLGEYISICKNGYQFINALDKEPYIGTKGNHSGFTEDELIIPLIIIND